MNVIERFILISVGIGVYEIIVFFYLIINFFILTPVFGIEGILLPTELSIFIEGAASQLAAFLLPISILLYVFYILMYIIYLIIIYIVPPTGFATLFIPIREILLKIPPLPWLIDYGIFRLIEKLIKALSLTSFKMKIIQILTSLFDFSRDNIKKVLIMIFPSLANEINYLESFENPELINIDSPIYKQIIQDKNICISQNTKIITPDMDAGEKIKINFENIFETIKCESKSFGNYIRSNK